VPRDPDLETQTVLVEGTITLGQFLKWSGLAGSGGEAKLLVETGAARLNDRVERHRGHKLAQGDVVEVNGRTRRVDFGREGPSNDAG
jgi:ribosome-associated protein